LHQLAGTHAASRGFLPEPLGREARKPAASVPSTPPAGCGQSGKACEEAWKSMDVPFLSTPPGSCGAGSKAFVEEVRDENMPPDDQETIPTPRTFQLQSGPGGDGSRTDPLAPTVKALTVTTMRSFWENQVNQVASARDSGAAKGGASPSATPGRPHGLLFRRSQSASAVRRPGALAVGRLRKEVTRQQKLMEDSSALLEELTTRIRGLLPEEALRGRRNSSSDSGASTEADRDEREEEDEELQLLRAYNQSSSALWRMQRQTVRLLLEHIDRLGLSEPGGLAAAAGLAAAGMTPVHRRGVARTTSGSRAASGSPAPRVAPLQLPPPGGPGADSRTVEEPAGEPDLGA